VTGSSPETQTKFLDDFDWDFDAGAIKSLITVFQQFVIPSRYIDKLIPWLKLSP